MAESAQGDGPLVRHLVSHLEINSSVDTLYDIFRSKYELFPKLLPQEIQKVEMISPDVWLWTFVDGTCGTWKNSVKGDKATNVVTWTLLEGEVPKKLYNALIMEFMFSSIDKGCKVKLDLTYEMQNITVPPPNSYMEFIRRLVVKAANPPKH